MNEKIKEAAIQQCGDYRKAESGMLGFIKGAHWMKNQYVLSPNELREELLNLLSPEHSVASRIEGIRMIIRSTEP